MAKLLLTPEFILNGLCPSTGKDKEEFCDLHPDARGLYIDCNISKPNLGIYRLRTKVDGKTTHFLIGRTNEITLDMARREVALLKSKLASGVNPKAADKRSKVEDMKLVDYLNDHYFKNKVKRSIRRDRELAVRVNRVIGSCKLREINRLMLTNFHTALLKEEKLAPATCDMHIRFIKHALQLAVDYSFLDKNPAARFPMYNVDNRSSDFLSEFELKSFIRTVQASSNKVIANLLIFMLSSGLRLGSALSLKWASVNMESRTITIPASSSKNRRVNTIPISDIAAEAILSQQAGKGKFEYVWINPRTGDRYKNINKAFNIIRRAAGVPTFHIHGLRRQFATTLANMNTNSGVIRELLNHASITTTEKYIKISQKTLHDSTASVSAVLKAAMAAAPAEEEA
jgi:integrase